MIKEYLYAEHGLLRRPRDAPDLQSQRWGPASVCMRDVFMFIFMHSIVEMVSGFHIDICGLMVSLLVCVDVGPRPPPRHQSGQVGGYHGSRGLCEASCRELSQR